MRSSRGLSFILLAAPTLAAATLTWCADQVALEFCVSTDKQVYGLGEPITVSFNWFNTSAAPLEIVTGLGPTHGVMVRNDIPDFAVYYDGTEKIPYRGRWYCSVGPPSVLESRGELTRSHQISDAYSFGRPGRYVIRVAFFLSEATVIHREVEIWVSE
jgi:hypothetical protein